MLTSYFAHGEQDDQSCDSHDQLIILLPVSKIRAPCGMVKPSMTLQTAAHQGFLSYERPSLNCVQAIHIQIRFWLRDLYSTHSQPQKIVRA